MVQLTNLALLAATLLSPLAFADVLRDPKTACTTFVQVVTSTETRYPKDVDTSVILYEYPVVTTVYATNTSTVLYTTDKTRMRTRTDTQTVSQCTVY
ncbi:uncharacterized protein LY89DRAFT_730902 [Mollisia scopiformis]|uniref:Uncharacterized protein n=1 Tax=Mollisia scopiformis TaxID=149040 RepID=A0A194XHN6_MOLSC|nr:uncharacterized protein LY89DRAFT_730902 [Mollisia scopiformis]KUJ19644.1 hypothetical protein LY89DRAFT_730902 [Mollisia scopiformis]